MHNKKEGLRRSLYIAAVTLFLFACAHQVIQSGVQGASPTSLPQLTEILPSPTLTFAQTVTSTLTLEPSPSTTSDYVFENFYNTLEFNGKPGEISAIYIPGKQPQIVVQQENDADTYVNPNYITQFDTESIVSNFTGYRETVFPVSGLLLENNPAVSSGTIPGSYIDGLSIGEVVNIINSDGTVSIYVVEQFSKYQVTDLTNPSYYKNYSDLNSEAITDRQLFDLIYTESTLENAKKKLILQRCKSSLNNGVFDLREFFLLEAIDY